MTIGPGWQGALTRDNVEQVAAAIESILADQVYVFAAMSTRREWGTVDIQVPEILKDVTPYVYDGEREGGGITLSDTGGMRTISSACHAIVSLYRYGISVSMYLEEEGEEKEIDIEWKIRIINSDVLRLRQEHLQQQKQHEKDQAWRDALYAPGMDKGGSLDHGRNNT